MAFFLSKEKKGYKRYIFFYALFLILNTSLTGYFTYTLNNDTLLFINEIIYTPTEFTFFSLIFLQIFTTTTNKTIVKYGFLLFYISWLVLFLLKGHNNFDSLAVALEEFFIIGYSIRYFYERLSTIDTLFLYATSSFWAVVGMLIYSAGTFFIYLFADNWWDDAMFASQYRFIHIFTSIIKNIILSLSILIFEKKEQLLKYQ
ncbi:MAG TPA: hypothetical protein PKE07_09575 [Lacibacter sp.]|nr:hypothetical protein [Lacibacter sp.]HMO89447.1 hypothetical protein [Lacibacter sp.]